MEPYNGRLLVGPKSPTSPGVTGEYMQPPPDILVVAWLGVTQTRISRPTTLSQVRPPVLAGIRDRRGVCSTQLRHRSTSRSPALATHVKNVGGPRIGAYQAVLRIWHVQWRGKLFNMKRRIKFRVVE